MQDLLFRMIKFKKENKELLSFLLFESEDEKSFITEIKFETEQEFKNMNSSNLYYAKKSIRKILRSINKYIRFSQNPETAIELLLHFCKTLKDSGLDFSKSTALENLYQSQIKKINKYLELLHVDLQHDYKKLLRTL